MFSDPPMLARARQALGRHGLHVVTEGIRQSYSQLSHDDRRYSIMRGAFHTVHSGLTLDELDAILDQLSRRSVAK